MAKDKYILFYRTIREEDSLIIKSMFQNNKNIKDNSIAEIKNIFKKYITDGYNQFIFWGFDAYAIDEAYKLKAKNKQLKIKVICNTSDSFLYDGYEKRNFLFMLEYSKNNKIDDIAFLKKSMYLTYKAYGYECSYILENITDKFTKKGKKHSKINIGFYPLNYTWDKNIYNQLSVGKLIDNSVFNYNCLYPKMKEFMTIMHINSNDEKIKNINIKSVQEHIVSNDIIISCPFTDYIHPIFFISMQSNIPCILGNNSDLFDDESLLKKYLVTNSEDNPLAVKDKILNALANKKLIMSEYTKWKKEYDDKSNQSIKDFLGK